MIEAPSDHTETKLVDRRLYTWCTKCRQGQGLWVCRHTTETHVDGFTNARHQRRRLDRPQNGNPTQNNTQLEGQRLSTSMSSNYQMRPTAHFSLLDYLDDYLPEEESQDAPVEDETTI